MALLRHKSPLITWISKTLQLCSCLFLCIDYCRVGWEIVQMKKLQKSAVSQEEPHSACGWITHHVLMKESFKYRTIQKALFQRYFMSEYDFGFLTHSLHWIGQQSKRGQKSTSEESDTWYEKRAFWQDTECLILMNCFFFFPFYLKRFPCNLLRWHAQCLRQDCAAASTACKGLGYITSVIFSHR